MVAAVFTAAKLLIPFGNILSLARERQHNRPTFPRPLRLAQTVAHVGCNTPLWRSVLKLDTDDVLARASRQ